MSHLKVAFLFKGYSFNLFNHIVEKSWILIWTKIWKSYQILKLCITSINKVHLGQKIHKYTKILSFYVQNKPDHVRNYAPG